jgi:hypothetical protein
MEPARLLVEPATRDYGGFFKVSGCRNRPSETATGEKENPTRQTGLSLGEEVIKCAAPAPTMGWHDHPARLIKNETYSSLII